MGLEFSNLSVFFYSAQWYSDLQTINNKFINSITDVNIKKLPFTGDRGFIIGIYGHSSINKPDDGGGIIIAWKYSNTNIQARALSNTGFIFKCNYDYPNWVIVWLQFLSKKFSPCGPI